MHTHTHARTGSRTHEYADVIYIIQNSVNTQLAWTISRDLRQRKMAAWNGKYGRSVVLEKETRFDVKEPIESLCWRGRSFHVEGPKTEGGGTNSGRSDTRNLEAESIRS